MIFRGVAWNEPCCVKIYGNGLPNVHLLIYTTPYGYPIARKMYMIHNKCRHYMQFSKLD